jgi:hypothetical protein
MADGDLKHLIGCRHFEIERTGQLILEARYIGIRDMAAVFAKVGGDAVGATFNGEVGGTKRVGMYAAARITQRRDMIDIDTQTQRRAARCAG